MGSVDSVFEPSWPSKWEAAVEIEPSEFEKLAEKYGDKPEWMRIKGYREVYDQKTHRRKSEMMLTLTGKDYWFPLSPGVYGKFIEAIVNEDRGVGLRYLQKYIRNYRTYKEVWPSKRYVKANRIPRNSYYPESAQRGAESKIGLSEEAVEAILALRNEGMSPREIARELHIMLPHVEQALDFAYGCEPRQIDDALIAQVARGDLDVSEAASRVAEIGIQAKNRRTLQAMTKGPKEQMRPVRFSGMKRRSPSMKVTPSTI